DIFSKQRVVFHNAKFDIDVAATHLGIPFPARLEDTMLLGFLDDPHSRQLGLKPMSIKYLGREPTERDELKEWILANVPGAAQKKAQWGAHISKAPGQLVGKYAVADVEMTIEIWKKLRPKIVTAEMTEAYERE